MMNFSTFLKVASGLWLIQLGQFSVATATEYALVIARQPVNLTGHIVEKITVNGSIPGPTLRFVEGDDAVIHVTNQMQEDTSIHWHGLLVPGSMDGVPDFNGFAGIKPGETFTYRFKIRQSGTYWYHAHSMGQEQDGHYGSLVIEPKQQDTEKPERDYVILISDFSEEASSTILANLKTSSDYYQFSRRTVGDFFAEVSQQGFGKAWENAKMWGQMRMLPTDLSDVTGYTFLINGKTTAQNWTGIFNTGESVRLRFINASAMSFYDVRIPHLKMTVIATDGQNVEPVTVDEFRLGVAETYDVIVKPEDEAYTVVAEPIDRTGFALATLAPHEGMRGDIPAQRPRALLTMADMGMSHGEHTEHTVNHDEHAGHVMNSENHPDHATMSHGEHTEHTVNHDEHAGHVMNSENHPDHATMKHDTQSGVAGSGWAQTGTPEGYKALSYNDLRFLGQQEDTRPAEREIEVRLGGNMERYIWTLNGKKYEDAEPMHLRYGERVRLKFINETMMAHPMHLHGMFVQLENGQPAAKLPNKHTVIVAPGDSYSVLLTADEPGEWAFHCHLLYHMTAGMMNKVVVATLDKAAIPTPEKEEEEHHHAH